MGILVGILYITTKTRIHKGLRFRALPGYSTSPIRKPHPSIRAAPYGVAKLYAYWISDNYHKVYGIYACNGILFNHESPHRGETFVTLKITRGLSRIDAHFYYCP